MNFKSYSFYFDPFKQSHSTLQGNLMVIGMFLLKTVLKIIYVLIAAPSILSAGAMIGIVIGSLALIVALYWWPSFCWLL